MKKLIISTLALAAFATPAAAQTADQAPSISGGRVEALVGWDQSKINLDGYGYNGSVDKSGVVYGIGLGYDFAIGATTSVGIDAEATDATTRYKVVDGSDSARLAAGRDLYVGGRITAAISPAFNLYGKVGYTNARLKGSVDVGGVTESAAGNLDGIRAGIGGQFMLSSSTYVGAEYRYSNYEAGVSRNQVAGTFGFRF